MTDSGPLETHPGSSGALSPSTVSSTAPTLRAAKAGRRGTGFHLLKVWVALLLALSVAMPAAAASDPPGENPQLEAQIQQGIALRRAGNDDGALSLFLDLEHNNPDSIRLLLHITAAAQATGRWLMAYSYLRKASAHRSDPYFVRYRSAIKSIEDATTQHVGQFRAVGAPDGAEVRLNGEVVGTLPMADPKPIEVGQYVLEVTKPGFYPLRRAVSVGPGSALTQESVDLREGASAAESLRPGALAIGAGGDLQQRTERRRWWQQRWLTWTLAGATAVAAGSSVAALIYRNSRAERWNSTNCLNGTKTRQEVCGNVRDDISLAQNVAIGTGVAAAVFAGATLAQVIVSTDRAPVASARAPRFNCSPGLSSVLCFGSF